MKSGSKPINWLLAPMMFIAAATELPPFGVCSATELFHNGGVGACDGCHGANLTGNTAPFSNISSAQENGFSVLKGSDPSSTCLICHKAPAGLRQPTNYYVATDANDLSSEKPPAQLTPAGDFSWLKNDYRWSSAGKQSSAYTDESPGGKHGHNIIAADFGYLADEENLTAPEGKYPAARLSCISCHDPHGNYRRAADGAISRTGLPIVASGSYNISPDPNSSGTVGVYRLLAGIGYQTRNLPEDFVFTSDPPAVVAPSSYNRGEISSDTRVAYGRGMSEWCQNCHTTAHKESANNLQHPAGNAAIFSETVKNCYNSYMATGNLTGTPSASFNSLVPFETGTSDYTLLKATANSDGSVRNGPGGRSNVMCLTCHRVHASGWDNIGRWNMKAELITYNGSYPGIDNDSPAQHAQGRTAAETQKALYDRPARAFGKYQKSLCNKCHAKD